MSRWNLARTSRHRAGSVLIAAAALPLLTAFISAANPAAAIVQLHALGIQHTVSDASAVDALLTKLSSPDANQRNQAEKQLRHMPAAAKQILEIAKRQVQDVRQFEEARDNRVVRDKAPETDKQFTDWHAVYKQKTGMAAQTIGLLGDLKAEEAMPFLLENSRFIDPNYAGKAYLFPYEFPCVGAMMVIGLPAADALLPVIEATTPYLHTEQENWNARLLAYILGPRAASGFLKDRIDRLVLEQRQPLAFPQGTIPAGVRIARLEAVRSRLEAYPQGFRGRDVWLRGRHGA
ncbi:MAG: hypothetical protein V4671_29695 [Armatimonadota bacterium]